MNPYGWIVAFLAVLALAGLALKPGYSLEWSGH